jgi:hypothetical protein
MSFSKAILLSLAILAILSAAAPAQNLINDFAAQAQGESSVLLTWTSGLETGLSNFRIERSLDGITYIVLTTLQPLGNNSSYNFEDHDIYKSSNRTYYYRILGQMDDNTFVVSPVQSVVLFFSGIQQTWGSIKALFR